MTQSLWTDKWQHKDKKNTPFLSLRIIHDSSIRRCSSRKWKRRCSVTNWFLYHWILHFLLCDLCRCNTRTQVPPFILIERENSITKPLYVILQQGREINHIYRLISWPDKKKTTMNTHYKKKTAFFCIYMISYMIRLNRYWET